MSKRIKNLADDPAPLGTDRFPIDSAAAGTRSTTFADYAKSRGEVTSVEYGVGTGGTTDYTTELQEWLDYCYANGKVARLKGFPRHSGLTITGTGTKFALVGDPGLSGLINTSTTGDDLTLDTTSAGINNLHIRDIIFDSVSTKTTGCAIKQTGTNTLGTPVFENLFFSTKTYSGISLACVINGFIDRLTVYMLGLNGRAIDLTGSASGTINGLSINELKVIDGLGGGSTTAVYLGSYVFAVRIDKADIQGGGQAARIDHGLVLADTSSDGVTCNDIRMTNSYIDTLSKELVTIAGGGGIMLSHNIFQFAGVGYDGVTVANGHSIFIGPDNIIQGNSRRGIHVTGGQYIVVFDSLFGNNGRQTPSTYGQVVFDNGVNHFSVLDNCFTFAPTAFPGTPSVDIQIAGTSHDDYFVDGNYAFSSGGITDEGTGTSKFVQAYGSIQGGYIGGKGYRDLAARSSGSGAFRLNIANTENLTADRTLTVKLNDANRTFDISGNVTFGTGGTIQAVAYSGSAADLSTGTLPAARLPAHTGDVTSSAGSAALTLAAGNAGNLNSGTLLAARMPALTGDITTSAGAVATTLATVNSNVGTFGSATQSVQVTFNAKGLATAASNVTITPAVGSITGLGTGIATALAANVGSAGAPVTFNGALGTPSSGVASNLTSIPVANATGVLLPVNGGTGVSTGIAAFLTFMATGVNFNSANTDNAIAVSLPTGYTRFAINAIRIMHASASLTTATVGVFTATGGGGTVILAAGTPVTVSTASEGTNNNMQTLALSNTATTTWTVAGTPNIYLRVGTPQGSAATADVVMTILVMP